MSESEKQEKCQHVFVFDVKRKTATYPPLIRGVCKKCGKQTVVTKQLYDKLTSGNQ